MSLTTLPSEPGAARYEVLRKAWPLIVASASTPLLGLADTAVLGRTGSTIDLGAAALGSLIFNFLYWSFGFLRMGTTGFVAQAAGRGDDAEVRASLYRALLLGLLLSAALVALQRPIEHLALGLLSGGVEVEALTSDYFRLRIWGAPAALVSLGLAGVLIGLGETRLLLWTQLFLNGVNIFLDVLLAGVMDYGVGGVALGTALSQWAGAALSGVIVIRLLRRRHGHAVAASERSQIWALSPLWETLRANSNILLRTLFLLAGFAWFTEQGARFGEVTLAANHVLLQFISLAAFFLDGYAHVAEALVGQALGARDRPAFDRAFRRTTEVAVFTGAGLAAIFLLSHGLLVRGLTDLTEVIESASEHAVWVALYIALSSFAFQLDGVFIGTTRSRALRNASFLSFVGFWILAELLTPHYENAGLWAAFVGYVTLRALFLAAALPALRRAIG